MSKNTSNQKSFLSKFLLKADIQFKLYRLKRELETKSERIKTIKKEIKALEKILEKT